VAGAAVRAGFGVPFLLAGVVKSIYDLGLYLAFRNTVVFDTSPSPEAFRDREPSGALEAGQV
jgi:hypothetical protein